MTSDNNNVQLILVARSTTANGRLILSFRPFVRPSVRVQKLLTQSSASAASPSVKHAGPGKPTIVRPRFLSAQEHEMLSDWKDGRISCRHSAATCFLVSGRVLVDAWQIRQMGALPAHHNRS